LISDRSSGGIRH